MAMITKEQRKGFIQKIIDETRKMDVLLFAMPVKY